MIVTHFFSIFWNYEEKRLRSFWRLIIQFILFIVAFYIPLLFTLSIHNYFLSSILDKILTLIFTLASIWLVVYFFDKRPFKEIGFNVNVRWLKELLFGLFLGAFLISLIFISEYLLGWIEIKGTFYNVYETSFPIGLAGGFIGFICVGFYEEAVSRGYQITNFAEGFRIKNTNPKYSLLAAIFASSLIFSLLHIANPNASVLGTINLVLVGLLFGYAFAATGSLAIPAGIHITWNFFEGNIFGFPVSGLRAKVSFLEINNSGPELWTGGDFGPEAGLILFFVLIIGFAGIFYWNKYTTGSTGLLISVADYKASQKISSSNPSV